MIRPALRPAALLFALSALASAAPAWAAEAPLRVAVMAFDATGGDAEFASLGKGLQAMITTDLHETGAYELIERSRLADVQSELALGASGAVDAATAGKIGKLVGATHLLAGSLTVVAGKMRIDARLFATESGKILLAEAIEGAKDEFFDLEKALVKKLVGATGVELAPKVRVKVQKVHTADFTAFKTYSDGVDAFDKKDYTAAVRLLSEAATLDPDFTLATLTAEQYEQEIAAMKTRALSVEVDQRRAAEIAQNAEAAQEVAELEPFWAMAKKAGPEHAVERLWGLYNLYYHYADSYSRLRNLHKIEDRFELERIADALAAQYFAEAQRLFPRVPLAIDYQHHWDWLEEPADDRAKKRHDDGTKNARASWHKLCARLHLDERRCGDLELKVVEKLAKRGADGEDLASVLKDAMEHFRQAADPDAATIAASAAQKLSKDTYTLKTLVKEVEANRDVKKLLGSCKGPWVREVVALDGWSGSFRGACDDSSFRIFAEPLSLEGRRGLTARRQVSGYGPMLLDDHPVWVFGSRDVRTGPRQSANSTSALVFYEPEARPYGVLSVIDGQKATALDLQLELGYTPLASWYPDLGYSPRRDQTEVEYVKDRPRVVLAFGLVDVDVAQREDAQSGQRKVGRPTRGYGLLLDGETVALVELTEQEGEREIYRTNHYADLKIAWKRIDLKRLSEKRVAAAGKPTVPVRLRLDGARLEATVGGQKLTFDVPKVRAGYYGLWTEGTGYVHATNLKVK